MKLNIPEKARLLEQLKREDFRVPDFIFISAEDFSNENFSLLNTFLEKHQESYKIIVRSCHPQEEFFKGGTFDSLETYADLAGIKYARNRIINFAGTLNKLSILRQQRFNHAPSIDIDEMGVIVMPFIEGYSVMAKMLGNHWEFGYCYDRIKKVQSDPYITQTPHDKKLFDISKSIQEHLGFKCEIEFITSENGEIYVVQAKDISGIEIPEEKKAQRAIRLDSVRRIRKRRNYRERPIFVMDNINFYINIIDKCKEILAGSSASATGIDDIINFIKNYEKTLEIFALRHERFAVLGLRIQVPQDLFQTANHSLDEKPELQKELSKVLTRNQYQIDYFLSEADTLLVQNKIRIKLCSHDAYGIDTVRNPLWTVEWASERHDEVVKTFKQLGFKTGDTIGIELDSDEKPSIYRL